MRIDPVTDIRTVLGESPVWDVDAQRLYWVDSLGRKLFRATADGRELQTWDTPANVGSICLRQSGGAIGAFKTGLHFIDFKTGDCKLIANPEPGMADNTLNDGKVDRAGRFWFGSMDITEAGPNGALYRLDPDLTVHRMLGGITVSNGPCWSPDGKVFYFGDSTPGEIRAFDFDMAGGTLSNERLFLTRKGKGQVDGATVDAEGYLWSAHVYSGEICRYTPDGRLDRTIAMPTGAVTSVMFGGPELDILFVTSMSTPLIDGAVSHGPLAGRLFAISGLGVKGVPEPKFGG